MDELTKSALKLEDFPPKLRKLGMFMINSGQLMTLKDACEATGINYDTIRTQIGQCNKKGNDFHKLINEHVIEKLGNARPDVYKSLQDRAINGTAADRKLFAQLTGDLIERQQIDHNHAVIVTYPTGVIPADIERKRLEKKEKQPDETVIDVEVIK